MEMKVEMEIEMEMEMKLISFPSMKISKKRGRIYILWENNIIRIVLKYFFRQKKHFTKKNFFMKKNFLCKKFFFDFYMLGIRFHAACNRFFA